MQLLIENRVPTANLGYMFHLLGGFLYIFLFCYMSNCRNKPLKSPEGLDFYLSVDGQKHIRTWVEVFVAKTLTTYCDALKSCAKYVK